MKKILFLILAITFTNISFGADKAKHRQMSLKLNEYVTASTSSEPNKSLVYFSSSVDVDKIDYQEVTIDGPNISDGKIEITRPTTTRNGDVAIDPNITECQSDLGEVTIQPSKLIVFTDKLPLRVLCKNNTGSYREFYQTIFKP
jgi:hypothetical protein